MRAQTYQPTVAVPTARGRTAAAPRKPAAAARRATLRTSAVAERTCTLDVDAPRRDHSTCARERNEMRGKERCVIDSRGVHGRRDAGDDGGPLWTNRNASAAGKPYPRFFVPED